MMKVRFLIYSVLSALLVMPAFAAPVRTGMEAEMQAAGQATASELFAACEKGDEAKVRALLQQDAELNIRNERNYTPLGLAIKHRHTGIVQLLMQHGADERMAAHYADFPKADEALSAVMAQESALQPMRRILTDGLIGSCCSHYDVYTTEELLRLKQCEPDFYAHYLSELTRGKAAVEQVVEACRAWFQAARLFAEIYHAKEIAPRNKPGDFTHCGNVRAALCYAIRKDAACFARHACWYTTPMGEIGPDTTSPVLYDFAVPANAPETVRSRLAPMQEFSLGKHLIIDLITESHKLWLSIQNQEVETMKRELLHDAEVIRLFDAAQAAWTRYYELMLPLHVLRCRCTNGAEYHELGIHMLSHRASVLEAIRQMSKPQRPESEYLRMLPSTPRNQNYCSGN